MSRLSLADMWDHFCTSNICECLSNKELAIYKELFYAGALGLNYIVTDMGRHGEIEQQKLYDMIQHELAFYTRTLKEKTYHGTEPVRRPQSGPQDPF